MVKNKESFDNLPLVPGLLSYREDNEKLYVNNGNRWDEIGSEKEVHVAFSTNIKPRTDKHVFLDVCMAAKENLTVLQKKTQKEALA